MLFTLGGRERSKNETNRGSISAGARPVKVQRKLFTRILMLGEKSTGGWSRATGLIRSNTKENKMNVYGRARASLTIQIKNPGSLTLDRLVDFRTPRWPLGSRGP